MDSISTSYAWNTGTAAYHKVAQIPEDEWEFEGVGLACESESILHCTAAKNLGPTAP